MITLFNYLIINIFFLSKKVLINKFFWKKILLLLNNDLLHIILIDFLMIFSKIQEQDHIYLIYNIQHLYYFMSIILLLYLLKSID